MYITRSETVMKKYMAYVIEGGLSSSFTNLHKKNPCTNALQEILGITMEVFCQAFNYAF